MGLVSVPSGMKSRLINALRYMVYGKEGIFDAEKLIDLLQALEKFTAVRDDGDGSAFKVDGVRGMKDMGTAGDFVGSQKVDTSDRETDVGDGKFRINNAPTGIDVASIGNGNIEQKNEDEKTVREALRFFFSPEGQVFREFMLEEIVNVVDASSREAVLELSKSLGLNNFPVPSIFRALSPELSSKDKQNVQQIRLLINFLFGDFDGVTSSGPPNPPDLVLQTRSSNQRLRDLIPVTREYATQLREYGSLLVVRLSEKSISRGLKWATTRMN